MPDKVSLLIRDGHTRDIEYCLQLDHSYRTQFAWQMRLYNDGDQYEVRFHPERLPRDLDSVWLPSEHRLYIATEPDNCLLVATDRETGELLGYLALYADPVHSVARLHDLVVSRPWRRNGIGIRLLQVARQWARDHQLMRMVAEVQTRNFPTVRFLQRAGLTFSGYSDHYFPQHEIAMFFGEVLR